MIVKYSNNYNLSRIQKYNFYILKIHSHTAKFYILHIITFFGVTQKHKTTAVQNMAIRMISHVEYPTFWSKNSLVKRKDTYRHKNIKIIYQN